MGQTRVTKKLCSCLVPDAEADLSIYSPAANLLGADAATPAVRAVLKGFRSLYGGPWVGGSAELATTALTFRPNAMNRVLHKGDYSFSVPLVDISSVGYEGGFVTDIIVVTTRHGRFKLRCFAARRFGDAIARTQAAAQPAIGSGGVERLWDHRRREPHSAEVWAVTW